MADAQTNAGAWSSMIRDALWAVEAPANALAESFGGREQRDAWVYLLLGVAVVAPFLTIVMPDRGFGLALVLLAATHGVGWYLHRSRIEGEAAA